VDAYWLDAGAFALRWLHVVAAIAWIGESFYFVALDRGLAAPKQSTQGLAGESWSVHGGGFYLKQKFMPAPAELPAVLHWSKWKSYVTWFSGFALLAATYLAAPAIHLVDPAVAAWSNGQAVGLALLFLGGTWLAYDALCRAFGANARVLGALVALMTLALCWLATHAFAGRAAFLIAGAALATVMSANVFFVIIPGQRRLVAALAAGGTPDPGDGLRGKQRSVHNTYLTLPVVFAMMSTHWAPLHAARASWLVLALGMAAGALIREFFVRWHSGGRDWWLLAVAALPLAFVLWWVAPPTAAPTSSPVPSTAEIQAILVQRCAACHSARPTLMPSAPKGTVFDDPAQIEAYAGRIHQQVVQLRVMPPGNLTQLSDAERDMIAAWYGARAPGAATRPP
jgi:uncharacterized membrane protein